MRVIKLNKCGCHRQHCSHQHRGYSNAGIARVPMYSPFHCPLCAGWRWKLSSCPGLSTAGPALIHTALDLLLGHPWQSCGEAARKSHKTSCCCKCRLLNFLSATNFKVLQSHSKLVKLLAECQTRHLVRIQAAHGIMVVIGRLRVKMC